jgi:hypothetical protein
VYNKIDDKEKAKWLHREVLGSWLERVEKKGGQ